MRLLAVSRERKFTDIAQVVQRRPEALRQLLIKDGHAPAQYRALTVRNLDPQYAAFCIKETTKLYLAPKDRVRVW